jgi:hypothetical protein
MSSRSAPTRKYERAFTRANARYLVSSVDSAVSSPARAGQHQLLVGVGGLAPRLAAADLAAQLDDQLLGLGDLGDQREVGALGDHGLGLEGGGELLDHHRLLEQVGGHGREGRAGACRRRGGGGRERGAGGETHVKPFVGPTPRGLG